MAADIFARTLALAALGNGGGGSSVDTYTKDEINKMFSEAGTVQVEAVDALPIEDIKENVIYLVPNGSSGTNFYDECMYINNKWETIGTTEIDMSQYSTTEELQEMMIQELAKYITSADFIDALKDYATKKYVDDSVAAIEIPSIEGLATEEYADAAGQKAFDDMAAIAGDINDLTTETHETFTAAINEINDKVNNIEIPSTDLSKYATKQDVQDAVYEIDEDRDMKKYFVTDYGVYNIFTLDFIVDEETYYTIDSELGIAIQDIMNDFAANSGHESSCIIIINDIYRNAFKLYVNRPGMSLTTISPVEFLEDGYIHRIECADVNIFDNEAKFSDVGYILKTSKTKLSADVDLTGYATETYVNNAVANATGNVNVFEGTQEEYDALSDEEKAKYTIAVIDDGEEV